MCFVSAARHMTSRIGLSSYAFLWQLSNRVSKPLSLHRALKRSAELGVNLSRSVTTCHSKHNRHGTCRYSDHRRAVERLTELGIKGIQPAHLRTYLRIAQMLASSLLRTVFNVPGHAPSGSEAALVSWLRRLMTRNGCAWDLLLRGG